MEGSGVEREYEEDRYVVGPARRLLAGMKSEAIRGEDQDS
jgi:hypothetical protein